MPGCPCYPLSQQDSTVLWDCKSLDVNRQGCGMRGKAVMITAIFYYGLLDCAGSIPAKAVRLEVL